MKMKKVISAMLLVTILAAALPASAAIGYMRIGDELLYTDFEDGAGDLNTGYAGASEVTEFDGENCFKFCGTPSADTHLLRASLDVNAMGGAVVTSTRFYFPNALTNNRGIDYTMYGTAANGSNARKIEPYKFYNGKLYYGYTADESHYLFDYPVGEWFTLTATIVSGLPNVNEGFMILEMTDEEGDVETIYRRPMSELIVNNNAALAKITTWQVDFLTNGTTDSENPDNNAPYFYIDDVSMKLVGQAESFDVDFDDKYYYPDKFASNVSISLANTAYPYGYVAYDGAEHGNVLKILSTSNKGCIFHNTNNLKEIVCRANGNAMVFEYDAKTDGNATNFYTWIYTGDATNQSQYRWVPFGIVGTNIYAGTGSAASLLGTVPVNKWVHFKVTYYYAGVSFDHANDIAALDMTVDGVTTRLYQTSLGSPSVTFNFNGAQCLVAGVGHLEFTVTGGTQYIDNIQCYSCDEELPVSNVSNAKVDGILKPGTALSASYDFSSPDGGSDASTVKWYRGGTVSGGPDTAARTEIGTGDEYTLTASDIGKYLYCEITPVSSLGLAGSAVTKKITVPDFTFNAESSADITKLFTLNQQRAAVTYDELEGEGVIKLAPTQDSAGGAQFGLKSVLSGITSGNVLVSADYYLPEALNGSYVSVQHFTTDGASTAGRYLNSYQIKGSGFYRYNSSEPLCELPVGEWFTIEEILSLKASNPIRTTVLKKADGTASVISRETVALSGLTTDGYTFTRTSYNHTNLSSTPVYIRNCTCRLYYNDGIHNVSAVQSGSDVVWSGTLTDTSCGGGLLIVANSAGSKLTAVKTDNVAAGEAESSVTVTIPGATLGSVKAFLWNGLDSMKPKF